MIPIVSESPHLELVFSIVSDIQPLLSIPLKKAKDEKLISNLVNSIIVLLEVNPLADTSALENQIDFLVYHLYGLTYDEVLIVDPETPISREEYEAYNIEQ